jgi:tetratricopeptide (TPR) repeat protein
MSENPKKQKRVMISSTARDLPEHREKVMHACMRLGMFYPEMMENLTATDANALEVSLKMVDQADIYVGVFAFRYGYVPAGETSSVTEAEYNRAVARDIPRLIFLMSDDHLVKPSDVETGEGAEKLRQLKERLKTERVVGLFTSADDLLAQMIQALVPYRELDLAAFHYVSDIPLMPAPYIAHPYTLLQTHRLIGRQSELDLLTDWVAEPKSNVYNAHILSVIAIGGMGKSALTWKWFNEIAPQKMNPLAGRMWWSFYESDAAFENFVTRALAYTTRRSLAEVEQISAPDREAQLLSALDREPFLIVLDGLERILIAYARTDAAHLADDDYDRQTATHSVDDDNLPANAARSFMKKNPLRKTADPRAGTFLRKLTTLRAARILISSRLYPINLQTVTGEPLGASFVVFLDGLEKKDAFTLWRAFGAKGEYNQLLPIFQRVENHPLLIQSLASEVARFRRAPGDFDIWRQVHSDFNPFRDGSLGQAQSHIMEFAIRGLDERALQTLRVIAAFRMPASYDRLTALLIGEAKPCADEHELDEVLGELEDRGLVGWDKRANRYDLHPIVRSVVWDRLTDDERCNIYVDLHAHFEALPKIDDYGKVTGLEDLTPAIELYNTLIGLGQYDEAGTIFYERLSKATLYRLSAGRQRVELLELLFPDGLDKLPRRRGLDKQASALNMLATGYVSIGQPSRAAPLFSHTEAIYTRMKHDQVANVALCNLSNALRLSGAIYKAEAAALRALSIIGSRKYPLLEADSLIFLGLTLAVRGRKSESESVLQQAARIDKAQQSRQAEGVDNSALAQRALWLGMFEAAREYASRAWELAHSRNLEADFIRAARRQGASELGLRNVDAAEERLHHALTRARQVNLVEEELPALTTLAKLRRRQGKPDEARFLLDDVWDAAERGPYPLFHADAYNVLAQLERDAGNSDAAIKAATQAYRLAWCDGPPFAYHWGLEAARRHLRELGAPEPELPPFDPSKYEPIPKVQIDPPDEFHA